MQLPVFTYILTLSVVYMCLQYKSLENTVGKEEIDGNDQLLLFPHPFYPIAVHSTIFIKLNTVVCKLFYCERVYNLSFGEALINLIVDRR